MMPDARDQPGGSALQSGQALELQGRFVEAIAVYDQVIAQAPANSRALGIAWMNRGNALQKSARTAEAVRAYDEAIAHFRLLPTQLALVRNHLGAACLNRGHALLADPSPEARAEAVGSFERAITWLRNLPLAENPAYRLNLAGAWANLAHLQIEAAPSSAHASANTALALVAPLAAVGAALTAANSRQLLLAGTVETERLLTTVHALRTLHARLAAAP